jgi:hypothetical protein
MHKNTGRRTKVMSLRVVSLLAILGVLIVPLCFGCAAIGLQENNIAQTDNYTVSQNTAVAVMNSGVNGDVNVEIWGRDYVEVTWTRSTAWGKSELDKVDVKATQAPGRLDIEAKLLSKDAKVSVNYDLKLPKSALLAKVTTADGNVKIAGTSGDTVVIARFGSVSVQNTSGDLDITVEKGKVRLDSTSGNAKLTTSEDAIEVVNAAGDITATNSNGAITVNDCKGNLTLKTTIEGIRVSNLEGCVLMAKNKRGGITIKGATAVEVAETSDADVRADIGSVGVKGTAIRVDKGSISLYLASGINANLELRTLSGEVAVNSSAGNINVTGQFSPQYFKGAVGTGGNSIYAETSKGRIDVSGLGTTG